MTASAETRAFLAAELPVLAELAPLVRSGVVVAIPEVTIIHRLVEQLASAARSDVRDQPLRELVDRLNNEGTPPARSNHVRGGELTPPGGVAPGHEARAAVQNPAFYLEKTLAIAESARARYIPPLGGRRSVARVPAPATRAAAQV